MEIERRIAFYMTSENEAHVEFTSEKCWRTNIKFQANTERSINNLHMFICLGSLPLKTSNFYCYTIFGIFLSKMIQFNLYRTRNQNNSQNSPCYCSVENVLARIWQIIEVKWSNTLNGYWTCAGKLIAPICSAFF